MGLIDLFGAPVVVVDPSVSQSVSQWRMTDGVTDLRSGGEALVKLRPIVPALVRQIVDAPISQITPLEMYGRVIVAQVIPAVAVDPALPFVIGPRTMRYRECYRRYWQALMRYLSWSTWPGVRRNLNSAARRLVMQLRREGLTTQEQAFFCVWLEHGPLGEYTFGG